MPVTKDPTDRVYCLAHRVLGVRRDHEYCRTKKVPSIGRQERWVYDSVCPTPDGCRVEPDGSCTHGFPSWLIVLGIM